MIELKDFILEKLPLSSSTVRTDKGSAKENNEVLTNRLKEEGIPFITHDNIIYKHLQRDGLQLNSVGFPVLAEKILSCIRRN